MMYYQVVIKRMGMGLNDIYVRPMPPTDDFLIARDQLATAMAAYPRPVGVVIVAADTVEGVHAEYDNYINGRSAHLVDPSLDGLREALEFAELLPSAPYPKWFPSFANYAWGTVAFQQIVKLMVRVHRGELGGKDDGAEAEPGPGTDEPR